MSDPTPSIPTTPSFDSVSSNGPAFTPSQHTPPLTHADLGQFTGDLDRYRHPLNRRVLYTPGVQFLAERAGAYWLIDAIASHIGSRAFQKACIVDPRIGSLHFWKLEVGPGHRALLHARADNGVPPFLTQVISFTDFPLEYADIWAGFDGTYWTLYLPSEH